MKQLFVGSSLSDTRQRLTHRVLAIAFALALLAPLLTLHKASAAQLTERQVTISTSQASATSVEYIFQFDFASTAVQGIRFEFCTQPIGACTLPTGMNVQRTNVSLTGHTGFPNNATSFAEFTTDDTNECDDIDDSSDDTEYCVNRTEATSAAGDDATITIDGIVNPDLSGPVNYREVYVRIYLYSDTSFATRVHEGTVAAAIVNQLTVSGRVQERLIFCVGALGDAEAHPTGCTAGAGWPADTTVDLGVIDNTGSPERSPVDNNPPTAFGDDDYGVAMVNTNAQLGTSVTYYAEANGTQQTRNFRVSGATCNASEATLTDQCFRGAVEATNTNAGVSIAGTAEYFGMHVACVYEAGTTGNLDSVPNSYNNADNDISSSNSCEDAGTDNGNEYDWNNTSTPEEIVTTTGDMVVDNEMLKMRFGAAASATTPTGSYTVTITYVATSQF